MKKIKSEYVCPKCGGDKYPDAPICQRCWDAERVYDV